MELRSCSHLHFIQAIKGGSVKKILNVHRSRPALTFKKIEDIYGNAKNDGSLPTLQPRLVFDGLTVDCGMIKTEIPCLTTERTIRSEPEAYDFDSNGSDGERNSELDDLNFGNMTLKHIKERCKAMKRKRSNYGDSSKETAKTCSYAKQDYPNLQPEDDICDLEEPLSSLKYKLSKKRKGKKKHMKNHVSTSSQTAISVVKSEYIHTDQDFLQANGDSHVPLVIKVEASEPNYPDCQAMACVSNDFSLDCNEQLGSCGALSIEVPETTNVVESPVSISPTKEPECCVVNMAPYQYMEYVDPQSVFDADVSGWEIVKVDSPEFTSQHHSDFPISEFKEEGYIIHALPYSISPETNSPTMDHNDDVHDTFQSYSSMKETSLQTSCNSQIQVPDMAIVEFSNIDSACSSEDNIKDDLGSIIEANGSRHLRNCASSLNPNSYPSPDNCLVSVDEDSPSVKKHSLYPECVDAAKDCSTTIHSCDASEEFTEPAGIADYHSTKLHHSPEKLLSTRKTISPASQEKLCKAMESAQLHDHEHYKCKGKLYISKHSNHRILRAEGLDKIRRAEVTINAKQINGKPKCDKQGSHQKGIPRVPHLSRAVPAVPQFSTGCTSIQGCSQSAIAFSQRQMRDIECIATKLTKELKSMKDIMKETLHPEACPATLSKHNVDEVRTAIENATRVEETARKWLSNMARDCSRFCKIMRLTQDSSAASENVVPKERKISFADEAGGKLCHIKVFEDNMGSQLESGSDKQDLLVK